VITQVQLLLFATLAYLALRVWGWYPQLKPGVLLDVDWLYRRLLPGIVRDARRRSHRLSIVTHYLTRRSISQLNAQLRDRFSDTGSHGATRPTGQMALWVGILLAACLLLYYT
jgi:multicomponent Na+:H+ antiporter subunit D